MDISHIAPSAAGDEAFIERLARFMRRAASPGAVLALARMNTEIDIRAVLPTVRVPTLVLHRLGDRDAKVEEARWIASQIPSAEYVELQGHDHLPWVGDQDGILDELEEFLTGVRRGPDPDRVLATVLFTDIVGSTQRASELGDRDWRGLLEQHQALVRRELARWRGQEINTTGDGFLASFDGPARAIRCAHAVKDAVRTLGLQVRSGVHTGECERSGDDLSGIAVHIGARIAAETEPGEVLVSGIVKDLVAGSGLRFDARGHRTLKGVPGEWPLYAAEV